MVQKNNIILAYHDLETSLELRKIDVSSKRNATQRTCSLSVPRRVVCMQAIRCTYGLIPLDCVVLTLSMILFKFHVLADSSCLSYSPIPTSRPWSMPNLHRRRPNDKRYTKTYRLTPDIGQTLGLWLDRSLPSSVLELCDTRRLRGLGRSPFDLNRHQWCHDGRRCVCVCMCVCAWC